MGLKSSILAFDFVTICNRQRISGFVGFVEGVEGELRVLRVEKLFFALMRHWEGEGGVGKWLESVFWVKKFGISGVCWKELEGVLEVL